MMRNILITVHLPRLIAQSNITNGLHNGLVFYYITDNFVQYTFKLFDLSYCENRLPAYVADFHYPVSNTDSQSSWMWPAKRSFTVFTIAGIIRLTNTTVLASFRLTS